MTLKEYIRASFIEYITIFKAQFAKIGGDSSQTFSVGAVSASTHAVNGAYADGRYALKTGSASNLFEVADPTIATTAVSLGYAEAHFVTDVSYVDITASEALADYNAS